MSFLATSYDPASGQVSTIPTARCIQMRRSVTKSAIMAATRWLVLFIFLPASTIKSPVPIRSVPMTMKSNSFQSTSLVNCIATKGIIKMPVVTTKTLAMSLCCIMLLLFVFIFQNVSGLTI